MPDAESKRAFPDSELSDDVRAMLSVWALAEDAGTKAAAAEAVCEMLWQAES